MIEIVESERFKPDPAKPLRMLQECPAYQASPVIKLSSPAVSKGHVILKDETNRMGLGAFKAVGGVYAIAQLISAAWEKVHNVALEPDELLQDHVRDFAQTLTFVCASAGNHGIAVAAGARLFGAKARIHLASTVPDAFAERLRGLGAAVERSGGVYEESLIGAIKDAETTGAVLLTDTSWPGNTKTASLVMEGYSVIAEELRVSFQQSGEWPTHVFLQGGVGGLAAGIAYMIRHNWAEQPRIIVVEPDCAPCLKVSVEAKKMMKVEGPVSNMGRLDCKEPSMIALDVLMRTANDYLLVSDAEADRAVDLVKQFAGLQTTPSGVAGFAGLIAAQKIDLNITDQSRSLVIISEGQP